ncbi:dethiobiotin synthase [Lyngbya sp. CCY1209]|uniref:dethiobiotin synthase n=1 Tax=Lyngbya sp. CCY1209 TaxID=2886103 RepID=UPI002D20196E|nr:dethiobiotin synthase [Lyngbya sp. CCY1209]MEB3882169.1 dethiobiotin synthase [Lyngbya sp. CCY1209]
MDNTLLIAGTDTEAGKTVLTSALIAYWKTHRDSRRLGVLKPLQSGMGDRELYRDLFFPDESLEAIAPLHFQAPLAPPLAAERENRTVELEKAWSALNHLRQSRDFVLVEALGGLGSPVTRELTVADLARDWRLPTVLVVPVRLGAIAQSVANVALARQSGVNLRGIVLNCVEPRTEADIDNWTPADLITPLTQIPILGVLPYLDNPKDVEQLARAAAGLELEALLPPG